MLLPKVFIETEKLSSVHENQLLLCLIKAFTKTKSTKM